MSIAPDAWRALGWWTKPHWRSHLAQAAKPEVPTPEILAMLPRSVPEYEPWLQDLVVGSPAHMSEYLSILWLSAWTHHMAAVFPRLINQYLLWTLLTAEVFKGFNGGVAGPEKPFKAGPKVQQHLAMKMIAFSGTSTSNLLIRLHIKRLLPW
jgi:hypothetical protein